MRLQRLFILFFFLLAQRQVLAQVYPVQGNAVLIPPYSVYISDYTSRTTDRLVLNLALKDITRPELKVRLRILIESQNIRIETKPEYKGSEITLQGGIPLRLNGTDLIEYFNPNNLSFSGITRSEFEQKGALPQGFYQFSFEVLEYNRGVKISNMISAPAWLILNDPPIVNIPQDNAKITPTLPQNLIFQWTPRHTGSPNSAFSTEYEIKVVEVWPSNRNPNDAILTSPAILDVTTRSTSFIYGPAETPLELGRRYAMRVRAKSIVGAEEYDLFKNNGYSAVVSFVYGDACEIPEQIAASSTASTRFIVKWLSKSNHTGFKVRYRQAGTTNWYENSSMINEAEIASLKPSTTYEYQVSASCGAFDGQSSAVATVKTKDAPLSTYSCGMPLDNFILDPAELAPTLKVGDIINSGDFDVRLTKVSGANGQFSGEGVVEVPFFNRAKARVEFTNITVNKELRMVNGFLNVTGAGVDIVPSGVLTFMDELVENLDQLDTLLNVVESNLPDEMFDPNSFVAEEHVVVVGGISSVYTDSDGTVVVVDAKGTEKRLPPGKTYAIEGDDGQGYLVDQKGTVHETTATVAAKAGNRVWNLSLRFSRSLQATYGFDQGKFHKEIVDGYEKLTEEYIVPWKAVKTNTPDQVIASLLGSSVEKDKVRFEMAGEPVSAHPIGSSQTTTVAVPGKSDGDIFDLIAEYVPNDSAKHQVLGKVKVITYDELSKHLVIVPVNTATMVGTVAQVKAQLDSVYHQAVVNWTVELQPALTNITFAGKFNDGESGMVSNYTEDMRKVINAYKNQRGMQEGTYYLFLVNDPLSGTSARGYMPRGKEYGFIFSGNHGDPLEFARTIAHELGHGAFKLQHIFAEEKFKIPQGNTDNVMDYPSGPKFYKYQWNKMRFPDIVVGLFEEDEDAEYKFTDFSVFRDFADPEKKTYTFLSPGGKPVTLPPNTVMVDIGESYWKKDSKGGTEAANYPLGTLIGFKIQKEEAGKTVSEEWIGTIAGDRFAGYRKLNSTPEEFYDDKLTGESAHGIILGFPCMTGDEIHFYAYKVNPDGVDADFIWPAKGQSNDVSGLFNEANEFLTKLAEAEGSYSKVEKSPADVIIKPRVRLSNAGSMNYSGLTSQEVKNFLKEVVDCGTGFQNDVFQIINLIQQNPGAYTAMTACGGPNLVKKETFLSAGGGYRAYYPYFVKQTRDALINKINARKNLSETVESIKTASAMEDALSELCEEDYAIFTGPQRAHILKTLADGDLQDCWVFNEQNCAEAQVIFTLSKAPTTQRGDITKAFLENDQALVAKLVQGLDNSGSGGNNFDRLSVLLFDYYAYASENKLIDNCANSAKPEECKVADDRLLVYDEKPVNEFNGTLYQSADLFTYRFDWIGNKLKIQPTIRKHSYTNTSYGRAHAVINDDAGYPITLKPFESVAVQVRSPIKYPGEEVVLFPADAITPTVVPAYLMYWVIEGQENKNTMTGVRLTAYAVGFLVGGVELATAKGVYLVLAGLDMFSLTSAFVLVEMELAKKFPPEWQPFIKQYNNVLNVYSLFRGGMAVSSLCLQSIKSFAAMRTQLRQLADNTKFADDAMNKAVDDMLKASDDADDAVKKFGMDDPSVPPFTPGSGGGGSVLKNVFSQEKLNFVTKQLSKQIEVGTPVNAGYASPNLKTAFNNAGQDALYYVKDVTTQGAVVSPETMRKLFPSMQLKTSTRIKIKLFDDEATALSKLKQTDPVIQSDPDVLVETYSTSAGPLVLATPSTVTGLTPQVLYAAANVYAAAKEKEREERCDVCVLRVASCEVYEQIRDKAVLAGMSRVSADNAVNKICEQVTSDANLKAIGVKLNLMTNNDTKGFLEDVLGNHNHSGAPDNSKAISNNVNLFYPKIVQAWDECDNARSTGNLTPLIRLDMELLREVGEHVNDQRLMTALNINGEDKYRKLLNAYKGPCNTCPPIPDSVKYAKLPLMSDYVRKLELFVGLYSSKKNDGFDMFVSGEATARSSSKQDGAYLLMGHLNTLNPASIRGFEFLASDGLTPPVQCAKCRCDVLKMDGTMVDYKSYSEVNSSSVWGDQFKQYFQRWSPNRNFGYCFAARKISDVSEIKRAFYLMFKNNAVTLFNLNPNFFSRYRYQRSAISVSNVEAFIETFKDTYDTAPIFDFVELQ